MVASFTPPDFLAPSPNGLVQARDGFLYGTTYQGGSAHSGTFYRLGSNGLELLYSFAISNGIAGPLGNLIQGRDGAFYGTTGLGGSAGVGTIYRMENNALRVLYSFTRIPGDPFYPYSGVIEATDGALYGTTESGGSADLGTVYKLNSTGVSIVHSFTGQMNADGALPLAGVVQGQDGTLYGTTPSGGSADRGTIFKVETNGNNFAVLHSFTGVNGDGAIPFAALIQGSDGAFYGTTFSGGSNNLGTVFMLNSNGFHVLYHFAGQQAGSDGAHPVGGVIQGRDGALYGTTKEGGTNDLGTLFKLDGTGLTVLHSFAGAPADGAFPITDLVQTTDGAIYGTTPEGGSADQGTIFKLAASNSSRPPVIQCPGAVTMSCSPASGALVEVSVQVSDPDGDALTVSWDVDATQISVPANASATNVVFTHLFATGTRVLTITVTDGTTSASCQTSVTVERDSNPPVFGPAPVAGPFVLGSGPQTVGPITASDTCGIDAAASILSAVIDTSSVGAKAVTFRAVDTAGNVATKTASYQVTYAPPELFLGKMTRAVLPPLYMDRLNVVKQGITIPVKFRVTDAQGNSVRTPGVVADFRLVKIITGTTVQEMNELPLATGHSQAFRWDTVGPQWAFNLSTKNLPVNATCCYRISLNDGTFIDFQIITK